MKKRKLKKFVVPMVYILSVMMLIGSVYFVDKIISSTVFKSDDVEEVETEVDEIDTSTEDMPVVNTDPVMIKPYTNEGVKAVKNFYDYLADESQQEESIIYYGDTYMQNSGIDYSLGSEFDVVSVFEGTVSSVSEDDMMGVTVKIQHNNDLVSVYQSMGNVNVRENDVVAQGTIIGKSGTNTISSDLGNHLHFELYYQGSVVNPDSYYGKTINEFNS